MKRPEMVDETGGWYATEDVDPYIDRLIEEKTRLRRALRDIADGCVNPVNVAKVALRRDT